MKGRMLTVIIMIAGLAIFNGAFAEAAEQEEWLKKAQLDTFAPKSQDWQAIEADARQEGKVVIYSLSSRIFKLQEEFKAKYGIEIEAYDLPSDLQLERLRREHKAGRFTVDVLFNREAPMLLNEYLPRKLVWNFVPSTVEEFLDDNEKTPLLIQRWSSRAMFYNSALNPEAPLDNLWDLTREEWKGKFLIRSPLVDSTEANMLQTIIQHAEEMASAYEQEFGEPITFSEDLKELTAEMGLEIDAGKEWIYRMLQNEPLLLDSTTAIYKNVANVKQEHPPVGITTFSKSRLAEKGVYEAQIAFDLEPVATISAATMLVIADRAPHPNAAKLLIRYMMEEGFWPWDEPGDYAARNDVVAQQVEKHGIPAFEDLRNWAVDPDYVYNTKFEFLNLFLNLR